MIQFALILGSLIGNFLSSLLFFMIFKRFIAYLILKGLIKCELSKEEIIALTRDGLARGNPDGLLNGFLAAWPVILIGLAGAFIVLTVVAFFGYATGICKSPPRKRVTAFELE